MAGILITGATGFVGSHLVEAVARNGLRARALVRETSNVEVLERHGVDRVIGDLSDSASLRRAVADVDTVVHLAAATRALRAGTFHEVNAVGTRHLIEAVRADGATRRLVYLSSLAAVGSRGDRPVRPEDEPRPLTAYGRSKLAGERTCLHAPGISTAVLRPPAVYGPGDRDLLTFFRLADRGVLPVVGSPERRIQVVHVHDLVRAVLLAAESSATGIFHVAEPKDYAWAEVLDLVAAAVGRPARRVPVPAFALGAAAAAAELMAWAVRRPGIFDRDKAVEILAPGWVCETESARSGLGFEAAIPLERGLRDTAAWYRASGWLRPVREQREGGR